MQWNSHSCRRLLAVVTRHLTRQKARMLRRTWYRFRFAPLGSTAILRPTGMPISSCKRRNAPCQACLGGYTAVLSGIHVFTLAFPVIR